jgi:hypothetical protein
MEIVTAARASEGTASMPTMAIRTQLRRVFERLHARAELMLPPRSNR